MATNEFKKMSIKNTVFQYVNLDKPRVWSQTENKSMVVDPSHPKGKWSITWLLSAEEAAEFAKECKKHFAECKNANSKISEFGAVHGLKKRDDGTFAVTASKSCMSSKGTLNKPVKLIDTYGEEIKDRDVYGGSKGTAAFSAFPANNPSTGKWGISLGLNVVQITERAEGSGFDPDVFDIAEKPKNDDDPFGLPDVKPDLDDEIPF